MANVALSTRLQERPERFILSGLQTCRDVAGFLDDLRAGRIPCIAAGAPVDLFGYSIGAFLAEVLLLADPGGRLRGSKAFLFCGGSTLGGMAPVSRYILDGGAGAALNAFFDGRLEEELAGGSPLARLFERIQSIGTVFLSLLRHERLAAFREAGLRALGRRIAAVALAGDRVIPGGEVARTLALDPGPSGPPVRILDFPFPYTHENPFPLLDRFREEVSGCFGEVFGLAADYLAGDPA